MSQGDYLKHKINSVVLKEQEKLSPVLTGRQYSQYKRYQLANTVTSSNNTYSVLLPPGKQYVYDMEKNTSNCSQFILCNNTQTHPNRVLQTNGINSDGSVRCFLKPEYIKQPLNSKSGCDCALYKTTSNPCACATSH